jgi:hypothetical protein
VEVVVRKDTLEISDGEKVIARFPNLNAPAEGEGSVLSPEEEISESAAPAMVEVLPTAEVYDLPKLREFLLQVKETYPEKTDSILLMEPEVAYEHLVGVMDAMRGADVMPEGSAGTEGQEAKPERKELFPDISLGDAP